jgi:peptidoglycan/xylan/chitin deacetylase (PgdA/CDA1 family)
MKRLVKLLISLIVRTSDLLSSAALRLVGRHSAPSYVVLYYHGIPADQRSRFARQMEMLTRLAHPLSLGGIGTGGNGRTHNAAVTFDDAFVSILDNAIPELERRNIPATVFVPTGSLGSRPTWMKTLRPGGERVMSVAQLRTLGENPLLTIGSHSISHPNFLKLTEDESARELSESKARLESILEKPVTLFSFPHGKCNQRLLDMARSTGYRRVFTIAPETTTSLGTSFALGRVAVNPEDWALEFRLKLLGAYRWMARTKTEN